MVFSPDERGQIMVEYALIILLIALAVILVLMVFGDQVSALYDFIYNNFPTP